MSDRQASSLRDTVASLPSGRSRRYSDGLKARILDVVRARREEGASWVQLSEQLGVSLETLRRWCVDAPPKATSRMRRVQVVAERKASVVSVVSSSGHRVEGLTLEQAITMLRALG
jgi:transposase-like protein